MMICDKIFYKGLVQLTTKPLLQRIFTSTAGLKFKHCYIANDNLLNLISLVHIFSLYVSSSMIAQIIKI